MKGAYIYILFLFFTFLGCQKTPLLDTETTQFQTLITQKGWTENQHESGLFYHFTTIDSECTGGCGDNICGDDCGDGCIRPCYYSEVELQYEAFLLDDYLNGDETPIMSSGNGTVFLNVDDMLLGLKLALINIEQFTLRSEAFIMLPSHLAYGKEGFEDIVPSDAALVFNIYLKESHPHY